jgi:hypothetical protein
VASDIGQGSRGRALFHCGPARGASACCRCALDARFPSCTATSHNPAAHARQFTVDNKRRMPHQLPLPMRTLTTGLRLPFLWCSPSPACFI